MSAVIERVKPPRIPINSVPRMQVGMGDDAAYQNGYRHGYEGVNSRQLCALTIGSSERNRWMEGYIDGADDRDGR